MLVVSVRMDMMSITVEMTRNSMDTLTRVENHLSWGGCVSEAQITDLHTNLTGKKEVGRAMSNCIEKLVRRTVGRDNNQWLEESLVSTNKY